MSGMVLLSLQGTRSLLPLGSSWKTFPGLLSLSQSCHPRTVSWAVSEYEAGSDDVVLTMDQILLTTDQILLTMDQILLTMDRILLTMDRTCLQGRR